MKTIDLLRDAITIFQGIFVEALPFLLMGVFTSSFVHVYVKSETILRVIPKSRIGSILVGPMMGFLFPVCECGNIPLARRMIKKGIPIHTVVAFLFASPVFNPIVILATYAAFSKQPEVVIIRVVLSLVIALIISGMISFIENEKDLLSSEILSNSSKETDCHCGPETMGRKHKWKAFMSDAANEFLELGSLLVLGSFIASFSQVLIPRDLIASLGQGPVSSIIAMMLLAAFISICSNVDAFFALSYVNNFSMGSIMAFLVFGPMIDMKVFAMLPKIFSVKTVVYMTIIIAQLVFLFTLFYNLNIS